MAGKNRVASCVAAAAGALLLAMPVGSALGVDGSDAAFNRMVAETWGKDTGSSWFEYYVEVLNQEIALKDSTEPFGAAGPSGPLSGFDGYVAGFIAPDTGSRWFNAYVDAINRVVQEKQH